MKRVAGLLLFLFFLVAWFQPLGVQAEEGERVRVQVAGLV